MNKARITLVAFTLFALVGTALAVRVQKFTGDLFCTSVMGAACAKDENNVYRKFIYAPGIPGANLSYCSVTSTGCSHIGNQIRVVEDPR